MLLIERKLTEFFYRCESINPQIDIGENDPSSTSPVRSPLIERLIPEATGAVYIIYGVDLNSDDRRHAHCTGLYKRHTPEGSLYCVALLDNEEKIGNKLTQYYSVLSGLGLGLGGCEILLSEEDLDKFDEPVKDRNSISCIKSTFSEFTLLTISNDSIKFDYYSIIGRWLKPDFGFDGNNSDDAVDFKPDGNPVIAVMKTLDGGDSTRISSFQFLEAVRDGAGVRLAEPYEEYLQRQMAR
jgi:hypothetical protein